MTKLTDLSDAILTNAIEAPAIHYWTCQVEWQRDPKTGFITSITFSEFEDEATLEPVRDENGEAIRHTVGAIDVISAMEKIAEGKVDIDPGFRDTISIMLIQKDYLAGVGGDANTDDMIVQVAALGEIIYG